MSAKKSASELADNPRFIPPSPGASELPVTTALDKLTITDGQMLEIMTRADPGVIRAAQILYIYTNVYQSQYAAGRMEQLYRLKISQDGLGRRELIDVVDAGGRIPDSALAGGMPRYAETTYFRED